MNGLGAGRARAAGVAALCAVALAAGAALEGCARSPQTAPAPIPAALAAQQIERAQIPAERLLDGLIEAVQAGTISAQTSGRVESIYHDVNDRVPAGEVLLRLRAVQQHAGLAAAQAQVAEASARSADAQARYRRIATLFEHKVVAKAALDDAQAGRDAANARLEAARAAVAGAEEGLAYTAVRAPYAGVIARRWVQVGELVAPGTPLFDSLSLRGLRVGLDIPQALVAAVRSHRQAVVYLGDRRLEATGVTVFPEASAADTFHARLDLPASAGAGGLYPGMFVKVGLVVGMRDALLVPAAAVIEHGEVTGVYVVAADGRPSLRQVRLGERHGAQIEVLSGIAAGERVSSDPLAAAQLLAP